MEEVLHTQCCRLTAEHAASLLHCITNISSIHHHHHHPSRVVIVIMMVLARAMCTRHRRLAAVTQPINVNSHCSHCCCCCCCCVNTHWHDTPSVRCCNQYTCRLGLQHWASYVRYWTEVHQTFTQCSLIIAMQFFIDQPICCRTLKQRVKVVNFKVCKRALKLIGYHSNVP